MAIKRQWEKGTLKHPLVSYVLWYDKRYFLTYVIHLTLVMEDKKIKYNEELFKEISEWAYDYKKEPFVQGFYPEHNDRYLRQCYYNLQEKADRKMIGEEEWIKIMKSEEIQRIR